MEYCQLASAHSIIRGMKIAITRHADLRRDNEVRCISMTSQTKSRHRAIGIIMKQKTCEMYRKNCFATLYATMRKI